jgi:hypothetical protein
LQGVYCWTPADAQITGALTLSGSATDQWVFQLAGVFTITNGASVVLSGGASACKVFFAVSSATIGTTAAFQGTILGKPATLPLSCCVTVRSLALLCVILSAHAAVSVNTGATVMGRLISSTAAVSLLSNIVDVSVCSASVRPLAPCLLCALRCTNRPSRLRACSVLQAVDIVQDNTFGVPHVVNPSKQLRLTILNVVPPASHPLSHLSSSRAKLLSTSSMTAFVDKTAISAKIPLGSAQSYAVRTLSSFPPLLLSRGSFMFALAICHCRSLPLPL